MSNVIFVRQQNDGNPPTYDSLFYKDNSAIARDYRPLPTNNFYKARDPKIRTTQAHNLRPHAKVIASDQLNEQIPFDSGPIVTGMGLFTPRLRRFYCLIGFISFFVFTIIIVFSVIFPIFVF